MRTLTTLGAVAVMGVSVLAGCGSSDDSGSSSSSGGGTAGSDVTKANVDYAKGQIEKFSAVPTFQSDAEKIDISSLKGKTVYSIPITTSIPFYKDGEAAMSAAARAHGAQQHTAHDTTRAAPSRANKALTRSPDAELSGRE